MLDEFSLLLLQKVKKNAFSLQTKQKKKNVSFAFRPKQTLRCICQRPSQRSLDGSTLLTDEEAILQRWSEHLEGLFNGQRTVYESSLANIPQVDVKLQLDNPPTHEESKKATMQLKVGKSPSTDGIPAEVYQYRGEAVPDRPDYRKYLSPEILYIPYK